MRISIIVAIDEKRGIGKGNKLMWNIPEDLQRFKKITSGHTIIMGRKTFESIGRPLPNRTNIIITRDSSFARPGLVKLSGCVVVHSLEEALDCAKRQEETKGSKETREIFIIGGGQIFEQAIGLADKLYITIIEGDFGADTFFPDYSMFTKISESDWQEENGYRFKFVELER